MAQTGTGMFRRRSLRSIDDVNDTMGFSRGPYKTIGQREVAQDRARTFYKVQSDIIMIAIRYREWYTQMEGEFSDRIGKGKRRI